MFAHVLSRDGVPPALRTIDLCLYTHDFKKDIGHYVVCTYPRSQALSLQRLLLAVLTRGEAW